MGLSIKPSLTVTAWWRGGAFVPRERKPCTCYSENSKGHKVIGLNFKWPCSPRGHARFRATPGPPVSGCSFRAALIRLAKQSPSSLEAQRQALFMPNLSLCLHGLSDFLSRVQGEWHSAVAQHPSATHDLLLPPFQPQPVFSSSSNSRNF